MTDFLLVAGLWLDGSAWDDVVAALEDLGHHAVPITLPGQGTGPADATLDDQVDAVLEAVDASPGRPVVVGHSAACGLAWLVADRRLEKLGAVVLIGGFPVADGETYADFFPLEDGAMPFPGWEPFEGPDAADLDAHTRAALESTMVTVPATVSQAVVRLLDDRRFDVPVVLVCPEFTPAQAQEFIDSGDLPELARAAHLELVDIDSGHWPMVSRPAELAHLLAGVAARAGV